MKFHFDKFEDSFVTRTKALEENVPISYKINFPTIDIMKIYIYIALQRKCRIINFNKVYC